MAARTGTISTGFPNWGTIAYASKATDFDLLLAGVSPVVTGDTVAEVIDKAIVAVNVDTLRTLIDQRNLYNLELALEALAPGITEPANSADVMAFVALGKTVLIDFETSYLNAKGNAATADWDGFVKHLLVMFLKLGAAIPHLGEASGE